MFMEKYDDSNWLWAYIIVNNNKKYITEEEFILIDKWYSYNEMTLMFEKTDETKKYEISEYKKLEIELSRIWKEIENTNFLPDWLVKTMKLNKLLNEKQEVEISYNSTLTSLISEYWDNILNELI